MGRWTFWALLGCCIVAAGAVYVLRVKKQQQIVAQSAADLMDAAERSERLLEAAVGPAMIGSLEKRQATAKAAVRRVERYFADRDQANLDHWFDDLGLPFSKLPKREDFERSWELAGDTLLREVAAALKPLNLPIPGIPLIHYGWEKGDELPPREKLQDLQRMFWVQDRLIRAFARVGGWLPEGRPIRGGEMTAGAGMFRGMRFDVQVHCLGRSLLNVLHALDAPFDVIHEDGRKETMSLLCDIENVIVERIAVDGSVANLYPVEPPVAVTFFINVFDYRAERAKR